MIPITHVIVQGPGGLFMLAETVSGWDYYKVIYIHHNLPTVRLKLNQLTETITPSEKVQR